MKKLGAHTSDGKIHEAEVQEKLQKYRDKNKKKCKIYRERVKEAVQESKFTATSYKKLEREKKLFESEKNRLQNLLDQRKSQDEEMKKERVELKELRKNNKQLKEIVIKWKPMMQDYVDKTQHLID